MKKVLTALLACTCIGASGFVYASGGTCAAPGSLSPTNASGSDSGNTCTDGSGSTATSNEVASYCGGQDLSNQPQEVYKVTLSAPGTAGRATSLTSSSTTSGYSASMYLFPGTVALDCASGGPPCGQSGLAGTPLDMSSLAAGTYYLVVGANQTEAHTAAACGQFTINWNGSLPVKLQKFSVN